MAVERKKVTDETASTLETDSWIRSGAATSVCSVVAVLSLSHVPTLRHPWTAARQASLSSTVSRSLLSFTSIESVILPES